LDIRIFLLCDDGNLGLKGEAMIKLLLIYLALGAVYALISGYIKEEKRFTVFVATVTGWPIFLFSLIGAGWNALLNGRNDGNEE
jgi:hypothetical protein